MMLLHFKGVFSVSPKTQCTSTTMNPSCTSCTPGKSVHAIAEVSYSYPANQTCVFRSMPVDFPIENVIKYGLMHIAAEFKGYKVSVFHKGAAAKK